MKSGQYLVFGFVVTSSNYGSQTVPNPRTFLPLLLCLSVAVILTNPISISTVLWASEVMKKEMIKTEEKVVLERRGPLFATGSFLPVVR
jgi:hypothetical protein